MTCLKQVIHLFMRKYKGQIFLLLAAVIWGSAFIFQKMGMDHIGPFTFGIFRFILGSLALLPLIWAVDRLARRKALNGSCVENDSERVPVVPWRDKTLIIGSLLCGAANFVAGSLQQIGIVYTTAGKAGFITSMDIVIVPVFMLFLRQKISRHTWFGIAVALVGLWLLCMTEGFTVAKGDAFVMACAVAYSIQILLIDHYAERTDVLKLSSMQFLVAGLLSIPPALIGETIEMQALLDCAVPILYVAILEVSVAFTLQVVGQKYTTPACAAIIMSLESVFAAICGALFLHETMSGRELIGCILMFTAFIISQLPDSASRQNADENNRASSG